MTSVKLADVAAAAGVAKSIASRVLNDTDVSVRPATRERVFMVAERLGYRPNQAARALNRSQTRSISMVVPDFTNLAFSRIVRGAVRRAFECEHSLLVGEDNLEEQAGIGRLVRSHLIDGVIIIAAARPKHPLALLLADAGVPHVFALRAHAGSNRNVTLDDGLVSTVALDYLHSLGHVNIGHIAGPRTIDTARRRAAGVRLRARELGLPTPAVRHGAFSETGGAEAARALLDAQPRPTAIFAQSLSQAVGAQFAIVSAGYSIPDEISLISYDDMPLAEFLQPPLTTIRVPLETLGSVAFDALFDQLRGGIPSDVVVPSNPEVIVRSSTGRAL